MKRLVYLILLLLFWLVLGIIGAVSVRLSLSQAHRDPQENWPAESR
jgi:hypothetical protein